jgi:hypothetical protein
MQGRLAVCHSALCRLLHCFGIAEPRELSRDGELLAAGLPNAHRSAMRAWADAYEVPIV